MHFFDAIWRYSVRTGARRLFWGGSSFGFGFPVMSFELRVLLEDSGQFRPGGGVSVLLSFGLFGFEFRVSGFWFRVAPDCSRLLQITPDSWAK